MLTGRPHGLGAFDTAVLSLKIPSPSIKYHLSLSLSLSVSVLYCYANVRMRKAFCREKAMLEQRRWKEAGRGIRSTFSFVSCSILVCSFFCYFSSLRSFMYTLNVFRFGVIIIIIIIIIMVLQPFVGPWPLLQFLDPLHNR
jgi:hypothetical protein